LPPGTSKAPIAPETKQLVTTVRSGSHLRMCHVIRSAPSETSYQRRLCAKHVHRVQSGACPAQSTISQQSLRTINGSDRFTDAQPRPRHIFAPSPRDAMAERPTAAVCSKHMPSPLHPIATFWHHRIVPKIASPIFAGLSKTSLRNDCAVQWGRLKHPRRMTRRPFVVVILLTVTHPSHDLIDNMRAAAYDAVDDGLHGMTR
jgi:hypothetical protein